MQEVYALLTAYQALIRTGDDALTGRPEVPMERISFTVLLAAATDTVTAGHGIFPNTLVDLVGTIGQAALDALLPAHRRQRVKARTRKNPHQQVRTERRTAPPEGPELHRPHHRRALRPRPQ
ncbi:MULTISPECIES: hypothetical protein [unclassified Streptomyces]|uniref:hypothetical protein n=1 Tax=unclassified Streptomyces TaxID=2593676 RepID=UPI00224CF5BA|nr:MULTISPECIES: hypothetical protein [unclassified Streptomyces]MCX4793154.1 hypothetical protein [Streptomyces sp. NBC_01242]WSP59366.1 hypothetical protein OG306_37050 [Streptomyces sp. NBC_01241]WSP61043.1 hypothetical protein OG466_03405 [Streptomyces sp. NBC_01240]WSU20116.1 hypothetical protein OG508_03325 [Streptomyces sp. NBC_01108]